MFHDLLKLKGKFIVEHFDDKGNLKATYEVFNGITNQGKNKILDCMFNAATQIAANSWYIGLIDNSGTPTLDEIIDTVG